MKKYYKKWHIHLYMSFIFRTFALNNTRIGGYDGGDTRYVGRTTKGNNLFGTSGIRDAASKERTGGKGRMEG